jgi:hypothetical protein
MAGRLESHATRHSDRQANGRRKSPTRYLYIFAGDRGPDILMALLVDDEVEHKPVYCLYAASGMGQL